MSIVVLVFVLAGCAAPVVTEAEKAAVEQPWTDCVARAIARLDDGKSDPVSIAYGIEPSCAVLYQKVAETYLKGFHTFEGQMYMRRKLDGVELQAITADIVTYRASHARQPSQTYAAGKAADVWAAVQAAHERHDYATEFALLRPLAERGDPGAQIELGSMYGLGQGVPRDDVEAVGWFRKAADQGNAEAQDNLGITYASGLGVPQDDVEAGRWFHKSADQGNAQAQEFLGMMYDTGRGVPQDYVQALTWFSLAAAGGVNEATRYRDRLEHSMTAEQVVDAQRRAAAWHPTKPRGQPAPAARQ